MDYELDSEFESICKQILAEEKSEAEWAQVEASDMFQTERYNGGFDADEGEFCFSVFLPSGEHWFQVPLDTVRRIAEGDKVVVDARPAE